MWSKFSDSLLTSPHPFKLQEIFLSSILLDFLIVSNMSSRRTRSQSSSSRGDPRGTDSQVVAPKGEFSYPEVTPEDRATYWGDEAGSSGPGTWFPSSSCSDDLSDLANLRRSCEVPEGVELRRPIDGEKDSEAPDGFFACYDVFLTQCHLWFPIPAIIIRYLHRLGLSISQMTPSGMQHLVRLLTLSYERGIVLDVDHFGFLLKPKGKDLRIPLDAHKTVVLDTSSDYQGWKKRFSFVRIDGASVEESGIPYFLVKWSRKETDPLPPMPEGMNTIIGSLRTGPCAWSTFSAERVRYAVTIFRTGLFADSPIPDEGQCSGYFVPHTAPRGDRSKPRKDKQAAVENDLGDFLASLGGECLGTGAAEPSSSDLPEVDPGYVPEFAGAFEQANQGLLTMSRVLSDRASAARLAKLRAKEAEDELARFQAETSPFDANVWVDREVARVRSELAADSLRAEEAAKRKVRRANRAGRKEVAEEMKTRRDLWAKRYARIESAYQGEGNYFETRGTVHGLSLTQNEGYSYEEVYAEQRGRVDEMSDMQSELLDYRTRMWEQWNPIVVSPDSVEVGPETVDTGGEVDQPQTDTGAGQHP